MGIITNKIETMKDIIIYMIFVLTILGLVALHKLSKPCEPPILMWAELTPDGELILLDEEKVVKKFDNIDTLSENYFIFTTKQDWDE